MQTGPWPIPTLEAQAASLKVVRGLFKADYAAAKEAPAKLALAKKLLLQGRTTADDPAGRYVLLAEARNLAVEAGDPPLAAEAVDEIARSYLGVSAFDMKVEVLEKLARASSAPQAERDLALSSLALCEEAVRVNNFAAARRAAGLAGATAAKAKSKSLATWAAYLERCAAELEKEFGAVKEALEALREDRQDAAANLVVGRYRALLKDDWRTGLSFLKKGGDATLKALAEQEARQASKADAMALGDHWLEAAQALAAPFKSRAEARAAYWYVGSLEALDGLTKARTEAKLARLLAGSAKWRPGLVAELFEGRGLQRKRKVRIDAQVNFDWDHGAPDQGLPVDRFSIRWRGALKALKPGKHVLKLDSDDGVRLWVDEELLLENWQIGRHRVEAAAYLTDKPHSLRIEYYEEHSPARIQLSWVRPEPAGESIIPPYALFHDAADERQAKEQR